MQLGDRSGTTVSVPSVSHEQKFVDPITQYNSVTCGRSLSTPLRPDSRGTVP